MMCESRSTPPLPHCWLRPQRGAPLVVFLHGFMGSPEDAAPVAAGLAPRWDALAVALPGHGGDRRTQATFPANFGEATDLLMATLAPLMAQAPATVLVGYSMGARVALALALGNPGVFRGVLVESGTPGLEDPQERAARAEHDAAVGRALTECGDAEGFAQFLEGWYARAPFDNLDEGQRAELVARRLMSDPQQLALAVARLSVGLQPNLWPALPHLDIPVLAVCGERDLKFRRIAEAMAAQSSNVAVQVMANCGHNVHFEHPDAYTKVLRAFLEGVA